MGEEPFDELVVRSEDGSVTIEGKAHTKSTKMLAILADLENRLGATRAGTT